jgi:hypothetical protein
MFEPECQNVDCPQCFPGKIYFDRNIGYYCMLCGHEFDAVEMASLIEKKAIASSPAQKSKGARKKPPPAIKEVPAGKAKAKDTSPELAGHGKPEQRVLDPQ